MAAGQIKPVTVASGIANIYARDALCGSSGTKGTERAIGGQISLLKLGVSHIPSVQGVRKHEYGEARRHHATYLEGSPLRLIERSRPVATAADGISRVLGPKMLELAAELTDGAHPYNAPAAPRGFVQSWGRTNFLRRTRGHPR